MDIRYFEIILIWFIFIGLLIIIHFSKAKLLCRNVSCDHVEETHDTTKTRRITAHSKLTDLSNDSVNRTVVYIGIDDKDIEYLICSICLETLEIDENFRTELWRLENHCPKRLINTTAGKYASKNISSGDQTLESVCLTPCGHYFHYGCFATWYQRSRNCAHCREILSFPNCRIIYKIRSESMTNSFI